MRVVEKTTFLPSFTKLISPKLLKFWKLQPAEFKTQKMEHSLETKPSTQILSEPRKTLSTYLFYTKKKGAQTSRKCPTNSPQRKPKSKMRKTHLGKKDTPWKERHISLEGHSLLKFSTVVVIFLSQMFVG